MNIEVKVVDQFPGGVFNELVQRNLENKGIFIRPWEHQGDGDSSFQKKGRIIRVAAFYGDELIGLSLSETETKNRLVMKISLVEESYRNQGIYKRMLDLVMQESREFDEVDSCHHILNNTIIALKLRAGFHVVGIDNSIMIGPRLRLRYYHNKKLLELMNYRSGLSKNPLDEERECQK